MSECKVEGCGRPLRSDNLAGYCQKHRLTGKKHMRDPNAPVRRCGVCDGLLNANNRTGFCQRTPQCKAAHQRARLEGGRRRGSDFWCVGCGAELPNPRHGRPNFSYCCRTCYPLARKLAALLRSLEGISNG